MKNDLTVFWLKFEPWMIEDEYERLNNVRFLEVDRKRYEVINITPEFSIGEIKIQAIEVENVNT